MNPMEKAGWTPLPHSDEDLQRARQAPETVQTQAETYRLAWDDPQFMTRRELRPVGRVMDVPDMGSCSIEGSCSDRTARAMAGRGSG